MTGLPLPAGCPQVQGSLGTCVGLHCTLNLILWCLQPPPPLVSSPPLRSHPFLSCPEGHFPQVPGGLARPLRPPGVFLHLSLALNWFLVCGTCGFPTRYINITFLLSPRLPYPHLGLVLSSPVPSMMVLWGGSPSLVSSKPTCEAGAGVNASRLFGWTPWTPLASLTSCLCTPRPWFWFQLHLSL